MINLLAQDTWRRTQDIAVVDRGDRVVILNLDRLSSPPVVLEGSAARIWRLIDEAGSEASLVVEVARAFDVRPAEVRADVHEFLRHLHDLGLITRRGESR
jgi:hypothetical protein